MKIPNSWSVVKLADITTAIQYGYTTSAAEKPVGPRFLRITDIQDNHVNWNTVPFCKVESKDKSKYLLKQGDIVFARTGATVGKSFLIKEKIPESVFASYLIRVRLKPEIEARYIDYFFKSSQYWKQISESQAGIGQPNVNGTKLAQLQIPLAPPEQQRLIVAEIEKQFSRLDEAVAGLKRVKANLKRYKAAVLKAAVEGKLTEEWRMTHSDVESADKLLKRILIERKKEWAAENPGKQYNEPAEPDTSKLSELPCKWVWSRSDQLFNYVTSGSRGWARYYSESGAAFLRMGNLDHDTIELDLSDIQRVKPPKGAEGSRTRVLPGDILISITADVGMVGIVPVEFEEAYINQHVALARSTAAVNHVYLARYLACKNGQDQLKKLQRGATKVGLGLDDIEAVDVPLPPAKEQKAIVAEIDHRFSIIGEVEAQVEVNLLRAERMRQGVLKSAFEGRLVN